MTNLIFRQLFEANASTYTYLLGDPASAEAVLIDPVLETAGRDEALLAELGLKLRYTLETHCHADHVSGAARLAERLGSRAMAHPAAGIQPALPVQDGEMVRVGAIRLIALYTPGHTAGDVCYLGQGRVFTGDTLLIDGCGRTDFQEGDPGALYDSITGRLFTLPDETVVYPAHDYRGRCSTTIGEQKRSNPRLAGVPRNGFIGIMENLGLPYPRQIDKAVPANRLGGVGSEPNLEPPTLAAETFFTIPGLTLVRFGATGHGKQGNALPREPDFTCPATGWGEECFDRLPRAHTIGLISETGSECRELGGALRRRGFDAVILQGGLRDLAAQGGGENRKRNPAA